MMLKKTVKDQSGKLAAVTAVLDQLSLETLKSSDAEALRKFVQTADHWAKMAAAELVARGDERKTELSLGRHSKQQ
ncbi:MAG: hypothetical protein WBX25_17940 [Rhodomicrobium sp.]